MLIYVLILSWSIAFNDQMAPGAAGLPELHGRGR